MIRKKFIAWTLLSVFIIGLVSVAYANYQVKRIWRGERHYNERTDGPLKGYAHRQHRTSKRRDAEGNRYYFHRYETKCWTSNSDKNLISGYWQCYGEIFDDLEIDFGYFEGKISKYDAREVNIKGHFSYINPPDMANDVDVYSYIRGQNRSSLNWFVVRISF